MPKHTDHLDLINITSPCSADWDSMIGNDKVRFCSHCNLNVHDFSEMTPKEAMRLVIKFKGRLCVRYYRRPDENVQTITPRLYQIGRRASRIAAGAFSAALSLSASAAAQTPLTAHHLIPGAAAELASRHDASRSESLDDLTGTLTGIVLDPAQASIPGAQITLINESTQSEQTTTSNEAGEFGFQFLEAGVYTLRIESPGFKIQMIEGLTMPSAGAQRVEVTLEVGEVMGGVMIALPSDPLIQAVMGDDINAVRELLEAGANVNVVDEGFGMTALAMATANGNIEMVQLLLWFGADVNEKTSKGHTALMSLSERSTAEVARALMTAGAKIDLQDEDGDTALMVVAAQDNHDVLQALLAAGAAVNMKNGKGRTALMLAAGAGVVDHVKALIAAGADLYERDEDGATALKYARENNHRDVVKVLRTYGAIEYSVR